MNNATRNEDLPYVQQQKPQLNFSQQSLSPLNTSHGPNLDFSVSSNLSSNFENINQRPMLTHELLPSAAQTNSYPNQFLFQSLANVNESIGDQSSHFPLPTMSTTTVKLLPPFKLPFSQTPVNVNSNYAQFNRAANDKPLRIPPENPVSPLSNQRISLSIKGKNTKKDNYSTQFILDGLMTNSNTTTKSNLLDTGNHIGIKKEYYGISKLSYDASKHIVLPPYALAKPCKRSMQIQKPKRSQRRSKFTQEQDYIITSMKRKGKSWIEIAEAAGVESYLAARNRYQVLIGQQGGGTSECGPEETLELRTLLDEGEIEKFKFINKEFKKSTGKEVDVKDIRELVRYLFWKDPGQFDVEESYLSELVIQQANRFDEFKGSDREDPEIYNAQIEQDNNQ
ncbi:hypothetical protein DAMA08_018680 [Martiniozyma asiatica (nom. inval.)]|nr:hypothetical protein DAMA08_018680 [Martiniozyma asiatica]